MAGRRQAWSGSIAPNRQRNDAPSTGVLHCWSNRYNAPMSKPVSELVPSPRLLLGPGPSLVHPRVLRAMSTPLLGHLDPEFLTIMNEVQALLRTVFQTDNPFTIAVSGTGSAGMEAALVNLIEPGDTVIVGVNGVFGTRMADIVERAGGKAVKIEVPWGQIIDPHRLEDALKQAGSVKAVALVHAETSTGAHQPMEEIGPLCRRYGALLVADAVTSLAGVPVRVDAWGIDACYSGTQKCLSCPPGLAPDLESTRPGGGQGAQDEGAELVPRPVDDRGLLGRRKTRLPPYGAHQHDLCAA